MRWLRWLEARYRPTLETLGYEYPPRYMVITEAAMLALTIGATVPRLASGPHGTQWVYLVAAVCISLAHIAIAVVRIGTVSLVAHSAAALGSAILFWQIPTTFDVVPLIIVLCITQVAAVSRPRVAVVYLLIHETVVIAAGVLGAVHQAWLIALTVAFGAAVGQLLQNQLLLLRAERDAQASRIALDRANTAGEVHDVVAHSLAVVLLNVTAARRSLDNDDDRAEAQEALRDAEAQGRTAMADIRRTIELLRSERTRDDPTPGLADIPDLVATFERAGLAVQLEFPHAPQPLPAAIGLAAFRVVQEALANVVKHSPGAAAEVTVGLSEHALSVRICCPAPAGRPRRSGGSGLVAMRSRVETAGGNLYAGPIDGAWLVHASFPDINSPGFIGADGGNGNRDD